MDPVTEEEMGPAWPTIEKMMELRDRNAQLVYELESMNSNVELTMARIEHVVLSLLRTGIITAEQYAEMNLDWEKGLNSQLQSLRDKRSNQIEMAQAEMRKRRRADQLVLPPGVRRK